MTTSRRPADWDRHLSGGQICGVSENTAAKVARVEVTAKKAGEVHATCSEAAKVRAEDAQTDLDAITRMTSEGGPGVDTARREKRKATGRAQEICEGSQSQSSRKEGR